MFDVRLRLYSNDGAKQRVLRCNDFTYTLAESGTPTLSFTVSERVAGNLDAPFLVGVEYSTGGAYQVPRDNLFIATRENADAADQSRTVKFTGEGIVAWWTRMVPVWWIYGNDGGVRTWTNATPGKLLADIVSDGKGFGWAPNLALGFTAAVDSAGNAWTEKVTQTFRYFTTPFSQVLSALSSQGYLEWWSEGLTLCAANPGTGRNRTQTVLGGPGFSSAPAQVAFEVFTHLLLPFGDQGVWTHVANPGADTRFGALFASMSQDGAPDIATATRNAQPAMTESRQPKRELAYEWTPTDATPAPLADVRVGDQVTVRTRRGKLTQRVIGLVLSKKDGAVTARAVVGSKLLTMEARVARRVAAASQGNLIGGSGSVIPISGPAVKDTTPPPAPSKPDISVRLGVVTVTWDGLDATGSAMPADFERCDVVRGPAPGKVVGTVGIGKGLQSWPVTGLPYNSTQEVWLRAVDVSGNVSADSEHASVVIKPLVDTDLIGRVIDSANVKLGAVKAELIEAGAVLKDKLADNAVSLEKLDTVVQQSLADANTNATTANGRVTTSTSAPTVSDGAGKPTGALWFRYNAAGTLLGTWRWSGSAWAAQAWGADALASGAVTEAKIAQNAVTVTAIANGAVEAGKIAANAVDATKLAAAVNAAIQQGIDDAAAAQGTATTANGRVTTSTSAPTASSGAGKPAGALWFRYNTSGVLIGTWTWNGASWDRQEWGADALASGAVTAAKIAANAVTVTAIANGAVEAGKIAANAVDSTKLAASVNAAIQQGIDDAANANANATTANGRVTTSTSAPTTSNGAGKPTGALWFRYNAGGTLLGTWTWNGTSWDTQAWGADALASGAVTAAKIAQNAVTVTAIANGAVEAGKIAANAVDATKLAASVNAAIQQGIDDAANANTNATTANGRVTTSTSVPSASDGAGKPAGALWFRYSSGGTLLGTWRWSGSVWAAQAWGEDALASGAVTQAKIAANAVTVTAIANGAVEAGKIASGAVTSPAIAPQAVTTAALAAGAVTAGTIAAGAVVAGKLGANSVTATEIVAGTITAASGILANAAVGTAQIADAAITNAKIASLDAGKISAGILDAARIAAGSIMASKLAIGNFSNLIEDPKFALPFGDAWYGVTGSGGSIVTISQGTSLRLRGDGQTRIASRTLVSANPGEKFEISGLIRNDTDKPVYLRIYWRTTSGGHIAALGIKIPNTVSGANPYSAIITAPSDVDLGYGVLTFQTAADSTSGFAWLSNPRFSQAITPELVVDGAITARTIAAEAVTADAIAANAVTAAKVSAGAITTGKLAAGAVTANELAANSVTATHIVAGSITAASAIIANAAVGTAQIADAAITNAKIASLDAGKISAGTLDAARIAANAITTAKIASGAVTANEIAANAITAAKIAAGTITAAEIATGAITTGKLAAGAVTANELAANSVTATHIVAGSITAASAIIANAAIGTAQIADAAITNAKIASLDAGKISAGTLDAARIAANSITTAKIASGAVTANEIAANAITAAKIAAGTITAAEIAANAITTAKIATNAVTANELAANSVTATQIVAGTITAASGILAAASVGTAQIADAAITNAKIASLDAGKISAGTLDAGRIAANSINATKLTIGNFTNLVDDPKFLTPFGDVWAHATGSGAVFISTAQGMSLRLSGAGKSRVNCLSQVTANPGEKFNIGGLVRNDVDTPVYIRIYWRTTSGAHISVSTLEIPNTSGAWNQYDQIVTAPNNVNLGWGVFTFATHGDATSGNAWLTNPEFSQAITPELLVDGAVISRTIATGAVTANEIAANAVTTAKIATNAVTANEIAALTITAGNIAANAITAAKIAALSIESGKIASNAITADKIDAGAITAVKIAANAIDATRLSATAITSKHTITGAKIQTTATANRGVEITSSGLMAYNASGAPTVTIDASSGDAVFSGVLRTGVSGARIDIRDYGDGASLRLYAKESTEFASLFSRETTGNLRFTRLAHWRDAGQTPFSDFELGDNYIRSSLWTPGNVSYNGVYIRDDGYVNLGGSGDARLTMNPVAKTLALYKDSGHNLYMNASGYTHANGIGFQVNGTLTVTGSKSFIMDHPTRKGSTLTHAATESPHNGVEYWSDGPIAIPETGIAVVVLPDYFEALTAPDHRVVMLTPASPNADLWATPILDGSFMIHGAPGAEAFWVVKARRVRMVDGVDELAFAVEAKSISGTTDAAPAEADAMP